MRNDVRARLFGSEPPDPRAEPIRIGRYVIIKRIGIGGMGLIYAAYDDALDRKVAVKLLRPERMGARSTGQARLLREAQAIARLSHPSVVGVYEVGTHEDQVFIAMEYVDGVTLQTWQATRSAHEILEAYIAAGKGLAAAHAAGIVHRDFKAENVLVRKDGTVRVLDFGLARTELGERDDEVEAVAGAVPVESSMPLTHTGTVMGTPAYMAPEQHLGATTDARTDQFSFCVALYEALYGYRPFAGATLPELRENVLAGRIEPEPRYSGVPPTIRRALLRGLAADPAQRFPDLESLLREIEPPKPARGRWRFVAVALGLVASFAAMTMWWDGAAQAELRREGERLRAEFEQTRIVGAEEELRRLRRRTVSERWDDLVLAYAAQAAADDPTLAIAALKHLTPDNAHWLAAARTIAADAARRGPVQRERGDLGELARLDIVADRLLAHGRDGRMHVWNLGTDELTTHQAPQGVTVHAFTIDADGRLWAAGADGKVWRLHERGNADPIPVSSAPLHAIATNDDRIAVGDAHGSVHVLSRTGAIERQISAHEAPVRVLAFHPTDASTLASGGADTVVRVSFLERRTHYKLRRGTATRRLHWTDGGAMLIAIAHDASATAWTARGRPIDPGYPDGTYDLAVDELGGVVLWHDGRTLSASLDGAMPLELDQREGRVDCMAVAPDGRFIAAAKGELLQVWHTGPDEHGRRALGEVTIGTEDGAIAASVGLPGAELLTASRRGRLRRWSPTGASELVAATDLEIDRIALAPDHRRVAMEEHNGAVHVLDLADPGGYTTLGRVRDHRPGPLTWAPDGSAIAKLSCSKDPTCLLAIYPTDGGVPRPLGDIPGEGRSLRYAPDGRHLAAEHVSGVWLWDVHTGEGRPVEPSEHKGLVSDLLAYAFVEDGSALRVAAAERSPASASTRPTLRVLQTRADRPHVHELFSHAALLQLVASDGRDAVMMQTADERAFLWFLAQDRFVLLPDRLLPENVPVTRLRVSPRGDAILLDLDHGRRTLLVDLASGQHRQLPSLIDPVTWTDDGTVVDIVGSDRIRRWVDPTPEEAAAFLAWLDGVSAVRLDSDELR